MQEESESPDRPFCGKSGRKIERLVQEHLSGRETVQEPGHRQQVSAAAGTKVAHDQFIIQLTQRFQTAIGQHSTFP